MNLFLSVLLLLIFHTQYTQGMTEKEVEPIDEHSVFVDLNGMPSGTIAGSVNALTGHYFESEDDLETTFPSPFTVNRYYNSGSKEVGELCDHWDLNLMQAIKVKHEYDRSKAKVLANGCEIPFVGRKKSTTLKVAPWILEKAVVNVCSPYLSGRNHILNKEISVLQQGKNLAYFMKIPGGENYYFAKKKSSGKYLLTETTLPNRCAFYYAYNDNKVDRIQTLNQQRVQGAEVVVERGGKRGKDRLFSISCDDGKRVNYVISKMRSIRSDSSHRYSLKSVEKNFGPTVKYHYQTEGNRKREKLVKRELPDNRFLQIRYFNSKSKGRKVSSLHAPVGADSIPIQTYSFKYNVRNTIVHDALGFKKTYEWTEEMRLSRVSDYLANGKLYRADNLYWGKKGTPDYTFLKARTLTDAAGNIHFAKTYVYDTRGNILKERVSGNLSGYSTVYPIINNLGDVVSQNHETYEKEYGYNAQNLVIWEKDGHQTVHYTYYPKTSLIELKTISDDQGIRLRYYYSYDPNGSQVLEIIDDGNSTDIHNLGGVTERRIKRIENTGDLPMGMPRVISELYLDVKNTGQEVLLKKTINTYTRQGLLAKEEVYDSNSAFAFSKEWTYDSWGNVLEETDPLGRKTSYQYDANGNRIRMQTPNPDYCTLYYYDYSNRLIKEEERHANGAIFAKTYAYDYKSNKVKATDIYGNSTRFEYDPFDRVVKRILPPIPDSSGHLYTPVETFSYNELNHPVGKMSAEGCTTKMSLNAYGKPYQVENPDGSTERIIYNLDGSVRETIDQLGIRTLFTYDYQSRKIKEEKLSSSNEFLSLKQWIYNAFHLLHEIDPEGIVTTYQYDCAGRTIRREKGNSETLYIYDSLGRQQEKWELYEGGKYRSFFVLYNVLDKIVEEMIQSDTGEIYTRKQYEYDVDGNVTRETIFTDSGASTTITQYNSLGNPVKVIAPDGSETTFIYRYDYRDSSNLNVPYEQAIDPLGNVQISIRNTHDAIVQLERKNLFGDTVQKAVSQFGPLGRLIRLTNEVIVANQTTRSVSTVFEYDSMGRETAIIEAYGDPLQKIIRKEYNALGAISKIFKPNGIVLEHFYDPLARLQRLHSSDGSINCEYTYDGNHNIMTATDLVRSTVTYRVYDAEGKILSETLDHGCKQEYEYDKMGRLKELTLPDNSQVHYLYDAGNLMQISRLSGDKLLTHTYRYGLSGRITSMELMNGIDEITYGYDACLRPIEITSSHLQLKAKYDSCGNLLEADLSDTTGTAEYAYQYDALQQLIGETGSISNQYQFDSLGNRVQKNSAGYQNNALNQLERQGETTYAYDRNGNLSERTRGGSSISFKYDALDRLIEVAKESEKTVYQYDPFHRRTAKVSYARNGGDWLEVDRERYFFQGEKEIGVVREDGTIAQLKIMGVGGTQDIGAAVLIEISGKPYVPLQDHRGNVTLLLDADTGEVAESYRYSAYGEEVDGENLINPWRYCGKRVDPETSWVYFGGRYYDPEVGKWTTPDPLWFVDGANLYGYVNNRPTVFVDPEGLFLDGIWDVVTNTVCALLGWAFNANFAPSYNGNCMFVCAEGPIGTTNRTQFDKRSHRYKHKGAVYGVVHYTDTNGIYTGLHDAHSNTAQLSKMAEGNSVAGIYNATHGLWDLVESFINLLGIRTKPVSLLHKEWNDFFNACGDDGIIIHRCHSQGAIQTRNALACYDPERRKRIHVIAVAPAAYIDEDFCGSVIHLVSKNDIVPWIDLAGRMRNSHNILLLNRHPDASYFDHALQSPTYEDAMRDRIALIRRTHGDLKQ